MKTKILLIIIFFLCFNSCSINPNSKCKITNLNECQQIKIDNKTLKYVSRLRIKFEGNNNGRAEILLSNIESDNNGIKIELPKNFDKIITLDWYSNECYITYTPYEIKNSDTDEMILIRYEFISL